MLIKRVGNGRDIDERVGNKPSQWREGGSRSLNIQDVKLIGIYSLNKVVPFSCPIKTGYTHTPASAACRRVSTVWPQF